MYGAVREHYPSVAEHFAAILVDWIKLSVHQPAAAPSDGDRSLSYQPSASSLLCVVNHEKGGWPRSHITLNSSFPRVDCINNMAPSSERPVGGIKGFLTRAGKSFYAGGLLAKDWTWWLAQRGGQFGLVLASTSMVILMPLIFEINREVGVRIFRLHSDSLDPPVCFERASSHPLICFCIVLSR